MEYTVVIAIIMATTQEMDCWYNYSMCYHVHTVNNLREDHQVIVMGETITSIDWFAAVIYTQQRMELKPFKPEELAGTLDNIIWLQLLMHQEEGRSMHAMIQISRCVVLSKCMYYNITLLCWKRPRLYNMQGARAQTFSVCKCVVFLNCVYKIILLSRKKYM